MRNCDYYEELISRSLDDELSVEERRELAVHLASCPSCSRMRQLMADISGLMEEDMEELPGGLHEDIMAAVRRSEMIKKNGGSIKAAKIGKPGRAGGAGVDGSNRKNIRIPRYMRNILATAACMALVIAAAVSLNPGEKAESVVMSRTTSMAAAGTTQEEAEATAAPESTQQAVSTEQPSPSPSIQPDVGISSGTQITVQSGNSGTIVTTPVPTADQYLNGRTSAETESSVTTGGGTSTQGHTIINPATPSPSTVPTATPEPSPVSTPVPTPTPEIGPAQASLPETNGQADTGTEEQGAVNSALEAGGENISSQEQASGIQQETEGEIHKTAPVRVFSLFPSLAELAPAETPDVKNEDEVLDISPANGGTTAQETPLPSPVSTPCPDPEEYDMMDDKEGGRELLLLLMGMQDENGTAPEEAQLPEGKCDGSYVIAMIFDDIPCEVMVKVYGEELYFSLAEIIIDPLETSMDANAVEPPQVSEQPAAEDSALDAAASGSTESDESQTQVQDPCEDFEPIWFKANCSLGDFTAKLDSLTK